VHVATIYLWVAAKQYLQHIHMFLIMTLCISGHYSIAQFLKTASMTFMSFQHLTPAAIFPTAVFIHSKLPTQVCSAMHLFKIQG
jgi:hypothetical protein